MADAVRSIDVTDATPAVGVHVERDFRGVPDEEGVLARYALRLPGFECASYYAAFQKHDARGPRNDWWPEGANRTQALAVEELSDLTEGGLFLLLRLRDGGCVALLPMAGPQSVTWFASVEGSPAVKLGTLGTQEVEGDLPVLAWACSESPYIACHEVWRVAMSHPTVRGSTRPRCRKRYPDVFRYLGWCSWEEYRKDISAGLLADAVRAIEEGDLPVRYVLVDDGHVHHGGQQLVSFGPNEKFPEGWGPLLKMRRPEGVRWMGLWLNFNGYWQGICPENALDGLNEHLMAVGAVAHAFREGERVPALLPGPDYLDSVAFYEAMIGRAGEAGFDFVKVDNQARNLKHYRGTAQPVRSAAHNSRALESACAVWMDGLINCMAHNILCAFSTRVSAVSRCSEDYAKGDAGRARRHLHNSYANMLWLGQTVWGDHDMFHSNDPASGPMMALSKAVSGGPVYLSDAPDEFDAEAIRPLCLEDGELLRPLAPAAPLPDGIFLNPFGDGRPYRVIAPLPGRAAALVAYNLSEPEAPVEGSISPEDYAHAGGMLQPRPERWELPEEGLLLYDWRGRTARPLDTPLDFRLEGFGDYFALLCPVRDGWAAVGRTDKYLAPAAVEVLYSTERELVLRMVESGPLAIWRRRGTVHSKDCDLERAGDGLWVADLAVGERDLVLKCRSSRDRSEA